MSWVSRVRALFGRGEPPRKQSTNPELAREQTEVDAYAERVAAIERKRRVAGAESEQVQP